MNAFEEIIKTQKVILRPMKISDSELIVKWRNDPEIFDMMFSAQRLTLKSHIDWFNSSTLRSDRLDYVVCLYNLEPIGTICYTHIDKIKYKAEIGKMIGNKKYQGKGLAKEAMRLWIKFGFENLRLDKIYSKTFSHNLRNIQLNQHLGFKIVKVLKEGHVRGGISYDVLVMELLKKDSKKQGNF